MAVAWVAAKAKREVAESGEDRVQDGLTPAFRED